MSSMVIWTTFDPDTKKNGEFTYQFYYFLLKAFQKKLEKGRKWRSGFYVFILMKRNVLVELNMVI